MMMQMDGESVSALPRRCRPKRLACRDINYYIPPLDSEESIHAQPEASSSSGPAPPSRRRETSSKARVSTLKETAIESDPSSHDSLFDEDVSSSYSPQPSRPKKAMGKARVSALKETANESDPSSYDSLFDADASSTHSPAPYRPENAIREKIKTIPKDTAKESKLSSHDSLFDADTSLSEAGSDDIAWMNEISSSRKRSRTSSENKRNKVGIRRGYPAKDVDAAGFSLFTVDGKTYVRQYKQCQHFSMRGFQQCRHCISRQAGDSCRFQGIRALSATTDGEWITLHGSAMGLEDGPIFVGNATSSVEVSLPDHSDLNRPMDDVSKMEIMTVAAVNLVEILKESLIHAQKLGCIRRARELHYRAMCDFCSTGLFSASFMCTRCGGEFCATCKDELEAQTEAEASSTQLHTCVRDKFMESSKRRNIHTSEMMIPVTRFSEQELQEEIDLMQKVIDENASSMPTSKMQESGSQASNDSTRQIDAVDPLVLPSQPLAVISKSTLDRDQFLATWAKGEPLVVTDVSTQNVWDPSAFIERYGFMDCEIVRCDQYPPLLTKERLAAKLKKSPHFFKRWAKQVKVKQFFETFGKVDEEREAIFGMGIWKLKDWPPAAEFSTSFPDIFKDFNYAVPMPDFTRRDGCVNISSLFPKNANGPDLGPKMYNAWPGEHTRDKKGTTCLHMDIADAVNILLYTAERESTEQAAQWDIFRAEDANIIRDFIRERWPGKVHGDPIHAQVHYLDDDALQDLYRDKGVYSWRILQRTGQAVFIPAGCAHQVCNLTDCIKVAVDFISPQNISRCFQLTEEFRGLTWEGKRSWKEDVLQLKSQLWYAWMACRALPPAPPRKNIEKW